MYMNSLKTLMAADTTNGSDFAQITCIRDAHKQSHTMATIFGPVLFDKLLDTDFAHRSTESLQHHLRTRYYAVKMFLSANLVEEFI